MNWLRLKILVAWVAIKILLMFFLKLVFALQLIMTENFGHSNGNRNSVKTSFFQLLHYNHGVDQWQPKILFALSSCKFSFFAGYPTNPTFLSFVNMI